MRWRPDPAGAAPAPSSGLRWRRVLGVAAVAAASASAALAVWIGALIASTPDVEALRQAQRSRPSVILAADGEVLGRFTNAYQAPVTLRDVSPAVIDALMATEDRRFYAHGGLDWRRIAGSAWATLHGDTQGGSTLTQQTARNLFPERIGREQTLSRKVREAITALRLERTSSKEQILEAYLNSAPFLYNVRGIEMAAQVYFGRRAADLDTVQAATLVGMLKGTYRYNPVRYPERALERRNVVLEQMVRDRRLDAVQGEALKRRPLGLRFQRPEESQFRLARHFVEQVRERVLDWAAERDVELDRDGLTVRTTLDPRLQRIAQRAVTEQLEVLQRVAGREWSEPALRTVREQQPPAARPFAYFWDRHAALRAEIERAAADPAARTRLMAQRTRLTAGLVAIEPGSGAVRAWVGSPDFALEPFDHVAQARRQPGSTFKPFVYGAALRQGISSERSYYDEAIDHVAPDGSIWRPRDAGEPTLVPMSLREALAKSKNTITAQLIGEVGVGSVIDFARAAGVDQSPLDPVPSLALGTSPVTLLEMAGAYATLAALGARREPQLITRIEDRDGRLLAEFAAAPAQVLERDVAERLVDMMRSVVNEGTALGLRTQWGQRGDLAGKTGTTQNNTDGWFFAMRPGLVAGAWVGFNDARVTMRSDYWGQGGHNALRLVGDFLRAADRDRLVDATARFPDVKRPPPEPIDAVPASPNLQVLSREPLYVGGN